jgi:DNA-directed RNA polymerase specialized sigma24 family protein
LALARELVERSLVTISGPGASSQGRFPTTHWSRVARAGDRAGADALSALAELCAVYWYPIYALIRRRGHDEADALDLTQGYFTRLLEKPVIAAADPTRGRFRAFLRADCGFYLSDCRDNQQAQKRGGGRMVLSIDARYAEGRYVLELAGDLSPDRLFDRTWALTLLGRALDRLGTEYAETGRGELFERLHGGLTGGSRNVPYAQIACYLGLTEAVVQQAASRLRKRYRRALRSEIAATLDEPSDEAVEAEIRDLFEALGR